MSAINTTYLKVLQILESFASAHLQVLRFKSDFLEQLQNFSNEDETFPIMWVTPQNGVLSDNDFTHMNRFTLTVYALDLIQEDRANINPVLNNTSLILNDLQLWLKQDIPGIEVITVSTITPINNYLMDRVAGWQMTLTVEVETYSHCEIPFATPPIISHFINDIVYNPYRGPQGHQGPPGSPSGLFVQTSSSTPITNTTTESTLINGGIGTLTVPANGFNPGDSFTAKLAGFISTNNNHTIDIRIKSGATVLATTGSIGLPLITGKSWELEANFTIRQIGPAGVAEIVTTGFYLYNRDGNNALEGGDFGSINSTTFDTTVGNTLDVTAEWGQASTDDQISTETFTLIKTY
jgi:hypothetical protein